MFADLKGVFCCKQSSWVPDENFCPWGRETNHETGLYLIIDSLWYPYINICLPAHLVLIRFVAQVFDQAPHTFCCRTFPVGPSVGTQRLIPENTRRLLSHTLCAFCIKTRAVKVYLATSGERSHICVGKQTQHVWPLSAPSAPGTSPDVSPTRRQSVLQGTPKVI